MAYGGDFGDEPNDYNFVMDGLLYSEHTVSSNITEYAKSIEPVQTLSLHQHDIAIANRYDFLTLDHLTATWSIVSDGKEFAAGRVKIPKGKMKSRILERESYYDLGADMLPSQVSNLIQRQ